MSRLGALINAIPLSQKGKASGVGTLDGEGHQPGSESPLSVVSSIPTAGYAEIDIRQYAGLAPNGISSSDSAPTINEVIAAASARAIEKGLEHVKVYGFGAANYYIRSSILAAPHVKLCLDDAHILLGKTFAGTATDTAMVFAHQTLTPEASVGTGKTTAGSYLITSVSNINSFHREQRLGTITGIPANTKVVAVDYLNNLLVIDAEATASGTVTLKTAATYYGTYDDFSIEGGTFDPNGFYAADAIMRLLYMKDLVLEHVRVLLGNASSETAVWAIKIGGRNFLVTGCDVLGGRYVTYDGIHVFHGQDGRVIGNYVESGDDALVCGGEPSDGILAADPDPIRDITFEGNGVRSARGFAESVYVQNGATGRDWEVTDITFVGTVGSAGALRNGGMRYVDLNAGAPGTSQVKRISSAGAKLAVGSRGSDDATGTTHQQGVQILSALDISVDATLTITEAASPTTGFGVAYVAESQDVDLKIKSNFGKQYGIGCVSTNGLRILPGTELTAAANSPGAIYLSNCIGFDIGDGVGLWNLPSGSVAGVILSSLLGNRNAGRIGAVSFTRATGGVNAVFAEPGTFRSLLLDGGDYSGVGTPVSPANFFDPWVTTINNEGGYTAAAATIVVTSGANYGAGDIIRVPRTNEYMKVASVTGNSINVVRGITSPNGAAPAAALLNGDPLEVRNITVRGNRALRDFTWETPDDALPGILAAAPGMQPTTITLVASQRYIARFVPKTDRVIRSIAFSVSTAAGSNDAVDVGLYNAKGEKLVSSGETAGKLNSGGLKSAAVAETIVRAKAIYYVALQSWTIGSTAAILGAVTMASAANNHIVSSSLPLIPVDAANGVGPLPATWTLGGVSNAAPLLFAREY